MHPVKLSVLSAARAQTHTALVFQVHTYTHTRTHKQESPETHRICGNTNERGSFYMNKLLSNTPTPFLVLHCLFHTIISFSHPHTPFYSVEILPPPLTLLLPHVRMNFAWICRPPSHPRAPRTPCTSNFTLLYKLQCPPVSKLWIVFKVCKPVMIWSLYVKY